MPLNWIQGFWLVMTIAAVVWYSTIMVYVAVRGTFDIRSMLKELNEQHAESKLNA